MMSTESCDFNIRHARFCVPRFVRFTLLPPVMAEAKLSRGSETPCTLPSKGFILWKGDNEALTEQTGLVGNRQMETGQNQDATLDPLDLQDRTDEH